MPTNHHRARSYAKDDTTRRTAPLQLVDYFSSEWEEQDIWLSWKLVVSLRGQCDKSARLENASWRLWTKTRKQLRTSSPDNINWLKASDVTHLYGPLQKALANLPPFLSCSGGILTRPILRRSKSNIVLLGNVYTPCPSDFPSGSAELADDKNYCVPYNGILLEGISVLSPRRYIRFNEQVEQRIITTNRKQAFDQVCENRQPLVTGVTKLPNAPLKSAMYAFKIIPADCITCECANRTSSQSSRNKYTRIQSWDASNYRKKDSAPMRNEDEGVPLLGQGSCGPGVSRRSQPSSRTSVSRFREHVGPHKNEREGGYLRRPLEYLVFGYSLLRQLFWAVVTVIKGAG